MARPLKATLGGPGLRERLIERHRDLIGGQGWRAARLYGDRLARLEAGGPVSFAGWMLAELRPTGVDLHDTVTLERDGTLTVVPPPEAD